jgi:hypothetical protein
VRLGGNKSDWGSFLRMSSTPTVTNLTRNPMTLRARDYYGPSLVTVTVTVTVTKRAAGFNLKLLILNGLRLTRGCPE